MANPVELAAQTCCAKLLESPTACRLPQDLAEAFATAAFVLGAAWALDKPELIEIANAQIESMRAAAQGSLT